MLRNTCPDCGARMGNYCMRCKRNRLRIHEAIVAATPGPVLQACIDLAEDMGSMDPADDGLRIYKLMSEHAGEFL